LPKRIARAGDLLHISGPSFLSILNASTLCSVGDFAMPQTPIDNTQASLALTQSFVTSGVFPPRDSVAGGAFLDEIFTFAFNFTPGGTLSANGQVLPIAQNTAVFSLIGTTYDGNGTTNFAIPNLGGVTMIGTGQGPGLSAEQLGVPDGASSVTLTRSELPPDLGGTSQPFSLPAPGSIPSRASSPSSRGAASSAASFTPSSTFRPPSIASCRDQS
jgi:microcystin-dependent protein